MELITRESRAAEAVAHARKWLAETLPKMRTPYAHIVDEARRLAALPDAPNPDAVDEIRGYDATRHKCDECGETKDAVVRIGQEPDYESSTAWVCAACLLRAMILIEP